jgi:alpha-ketoglutarate-dependent taurine dioxygenase
VDPRVPYAGSGLAIARLGDRRDGPVVATLESHEADLCAWAALHRRAVDDLVERHKAVLFRGLRIDTVDRFQALLAGLGADLLDYAERSTPRSTVDDKVYTSTEYPPSDEIPMHNESSYSQRWPRRVFFCCLRPAAQGGATPIADSRVVYAHLDAHLRQTFLDKRVMYVRNYGQGVDLTWQDAFQTDDRRQVEAYCRAADISFEWFDGGSGLHTHQVRPAALCCARTGERVWFNQAHLFHVSSLEPALREALRGVFPPDRLPRHACYGDGTAIDDDVMYEIRAVYARVRLLVEWQAGDVLLLDNLFYAHGRLPFAGERKVIVAMDTIGGPGTATL